MTNRRLIILVTLMIIGLVGAFVFIGLTPKNAEYVLSRRVPKVVAIIITAVAIALSSVIFQTVSNNRILTPSVLGLDSLYMLIQTAVIFVLGSTHKLVLNRNFNFLVTVALMIVFSGVLYKKLLGDENADVMKLLLVGIILGTLFESLSGFMQMMIDPNEFLHVQDKMFASFNAVNTDILKITVLIVGGIGLYLFKKTDELDVMSLGRDQAVNLGLNYDSMLTSMLFLVSVLVSVSTALVGPITFLGLLVVNLGRELLDTYEHKYLFIISSLLGILALVGGQLLVERIMNFSTPISVIINLIGGIYFIYLLLKENLA